MAKKHLLNIKNVEITVRNILREDYQIDNEELINGFVSQVIGYVEYAQLTSYKELKCYMDGLFTMIDTEEFGTIE